MDPGPLPWNLSTIGYFHLQNTQATHSMEMVFFSLSFFFLLNEQKENSNGDHRIRLII